MRIISLSPAITEILFAIGAGDQIVANTYLCDYPPIAKKIPKAGSFSFIDFKKMKQFKPDLVITSTVVQKRMYDELKANNFTVAHFDPRSLKDIMKSIEEIGVLVGKEKEAILTVKEMKKKVKYFKSKRRSKKPRVYIEEWYDPPMYSGNWVPEIVKIAGGEYGIAKKNDISRTTPEKKLFAFNPQFIFVSYCGFGTNSDVNKVLNRRGWKKVSAIKSKKVFTINETLLNRPGPRVVDVIGEIQNLIFANK